MLILGSLKPTNVDGDYRRSPIMLYRFSRITQPEIGVLVGGIDYGAVSQARSGLRKRLGKNRKLSTQFIKIGHQLAYFSRSKI